MGHAKFPKFAFRPAFESRIDLRDLGSLENIQLESITAMTGECCGSPTWASVDIWNIQGQTPLRKESWMSTTYEPTAEEANITPIVQTQVAEDQQTIENETTKPLLPILGRGLIFSIILVVLV